MGAGMSPQVWRAQFVLSITQIAAWGSLFYAIALLGPRIEAETGWPDAIVYGGFACGLLAAGLAAPFVGRAIDRHGGRPVLAIGSVVAGAGLAFVALARSEWAYVLAW